MLHADKSMDSCRHHAGLDREDLRLEQLLLDTVDRGVVVLGLWIEVREDSRADVSVRSGPV